MPNPVTVDTVLPGYRLGTDQGRVAFCGVNLIQGADEAGVHRRILVDTGHAGRREPLEAELGRRGISPSDIDVLVCTHAHWDHIENLYLFGRAQVLIHQNERRYARRPHTNDFGCPPWIGSVLDLFQDRITQVQEGTQIIPGVRIVDAPGHSAGSMAVAAATADGVAVIAGDAIQNSTVAVQRRNALVFWDDMLASRTISKLLEIADIIYPGHDQAFRIDAGNKAEYVQDFRLTLTYVSPSQPGLNFDENPGPDHFVMPGIEQQTLPDLDNQERRGFTITLIKMQTICGR